MNRSAAEIFSEARELPAAERASFLTRACGSDLALRAKVEALLKADAEAGGFMASPTAGSAARAGAAASQEQAGAMIDRYKLLEQIGEGGMGTIWMAEQREPVKRRVALKVIKLGMDTKQVIARFEAERQALAMMDHPHIAKVFDAGATETGRPYFVMEYIKGIPILEYCDKEKLDTKARLELFTSVCHAIQHAHQKGIIHRDIKPSNVLVTLHDGTPVPKVIDFGIAKATNSELTAKTLFTEHRQMIGTPAYMSPEQAEMSGLDIDTRSDIYSLGVLLYELLTGTTPFDIKSLLESGFAEMLRAIREDEPHKPSTRISSLGDTGTRTALQRKIDLKKLSTLLRGDLDWIVMKCLEKDRSRRYDTANGLAADIKRHLADEPVTAGAPSAGYKLRKFVKRNRAQVIAGAAVAAALLIGVVAFAWQAKVARDQRDLAVQAQESESEQRKLADAARAEAQTQQAKAKEQEAEAIKQAAEAKTQEAEAKEQAAIAEAVAKFQTDMLAAADPQKLLGDKVTVVQAIEGAIAKLDQDALAGQPMVEARVRTTIGETLSALGRFDDAEPNLRRSLELRRAALPAGDPGIAHGMDGLAMLLMVQNKLAEAEQLQREALEIIRAALPDGHLQVGHFAHNLARILQAAQNKPAEAEQLYCEALDIFREALPAGHLEISVGLNNLAMLLNQQNRIDEAEPLYREALDIRRACLPAGHPELARGLHNLAELLRVQHRFAEAEPLNSEALAIWRAALPAGHPDIAAALNTFALLLKAQNKFAEAEPPAREALEIWRAALPAGHPSIATCLGNLASILHLQNKLAEAEPLYREAVEIRRTFLPAGQLEFASVVYNFAVLLKTQNRLAEAEPLYREAVDIRRASLPVGHPDLALALHNFAALLRDRNKLAEAEPLHREALANWRATRPARPSDIAAALHNLALLLKTQKKFAEAEPLAREALETWRAALPAGHPNIATCLSNLASILYLQNKLDEAEPLFREAVEIRRKALPAGQPELATALHNFAVLLKTQNKLDEAEPLFREAVEIRRKALPAGHADLLAAERNLADVYGRLGKFDQAAPLLRELLESDRAALPNDSPQLASRLVQLSQALIALEAWDQAEPLIREALTICEKAEPDAWTTFDCKSLLGAVFLGRKQLAEAEPLLLDGYRGMKEHEASIPPQGATRIPESLERLVQLYEAKGDTSEAAGWRSQLEAARVEPAKTPAPVDK